MMVLPDEDGPNSFDKSTVIVRISVHGHLNVLHRMAPQPFVEKQT